MKNITCNQRWHSHSSCRNHRCTRNIIFWGWRRQSRRTTFCRYVSTCSVFDYRWLFLSHSNSVVWWRAAWHLHVGCDGTEYWNSLATSLWILATTGGHVLCQYTDWLLHSCRWAPVVFFIGMSFLKKKLLYINHVCILLYTTMYYNYKHL